MSEHIVEVNDDNFVQNVLEADKPVLIDFWAQWCAPCKMLAPTFADVASEKSSELSFAKMDIDNNEKTPAKYGIMSIPTLLLFKGGEVVAQHSGMLSKTELVDFINDNL